MLFSRVHFLLGRGEATGSRASGEPNSFAFPAPGIQSAWSAVGCHAVAVIVVDEGVIMCRLLRRCMQSLDVCFPEARAGRSTSRAESIPSPSASRSKLIRRGIHTMLLMEAKRGTSQYSKILDLGKFEKHKMFKIIEMMSFVMV